mmetsp:Transcript_8306/g.20271  ORF Transcript_8306/g.20271 Transcript_8306/m.20271 type:complete len:464 (-) Transcript_8306:729-2120(-)
MTRALGSRAGGPECKEARADAHRCRVRRHERGAAYLSPRGAPPPRLPAPRGGRCGRQHPTSLEGSAAARWCRQSRVSGADSDVGDLDLLLGRRHGHLLVARCGDALARHRVLARGLSVQSGQLPHVLVDEEADETGGKAQAVTHDVPAQEDGAGAIAHSVVLHDGGHAADLAAVERVHDAKDGAGGPREDEGEGSLAPPVARAWGGVVLPEDEEPHGGAEAHDHGARDSGARDGGLVHVEVERAHHCEEDDGAACDQDVGAADVGDVVELEGASLLAIVAGELEPAAELQGDELGRGGEGGVEGGHGGGHHHQVDEGEGCGAERASHLGRRVGDAHLTRAVGGVDAHNGEEDDEHHGDEAADGEGGDHGARAREEGAVREHGVVEWVADTALDDGCNKPRVAAGLPAALGLVGDEAADAAGHLGTDEPEDDDEEDDAKACLEHVGDEGGAHAAHHHVGGRDDG